ncbi:MAG: hypothetical protein KDN20_26260 [Verrucomicrobiae bacterium]|nr:hypothetical protein [Verrucomicrobiae bacterium]
MNHRSDSRLTILVSLAALLWCLPFLAKARQPIDRILVPKTPEVTGNFGAAMAVNDRWIAVGEPGAESGRGVVSIYSAATGRLVRELRAPDAADGDAFGSSLSLCGNKLLIGAPDFGNNVGVAYLMDVRNGRQIHRFQASPAVTQDRFGEAVALSDRYAVVGLPGRNSGAGRVVVYDTITGELEPNGLSAEDATAGDEFGKSLSVHGELVLVGAPEKGTGTGGAYLFDLRSGRQLRKLTSPNSSAFKYFGRDLALDGTRAIVGEPGIGTDGRAYLFDLRTTDPPVTFPVLGGSAGFQVELDGNLALIGAPDDEVAYLFDVARMERLRTLTPSDGFNSFGQVLAFGGDQALFGVSASGGGAVHFLRPLAGPLPLETVTQVRNSAPGTVQADFRNFFQPLINPDGEVFFTAGLMGPGTGGGMNQGLWTNFQGGVDDLGISGGSAELIGPGLKTGRMLRFVSSRADSMVFEVLLRGPGVTAFNNRVLLTFDGTQANQLRTGTALTALGDVEIQSLPEILHTSENPPGSTPTDRLLLPYRYRQGPGGVTATNDTGILLTDSFASNVADFKAREGESASGLDTFGQFFGRAAASSTSFYAFSAFVIPEGGGRPLRQCFTTSSGGSLFSVVREGQKAPNLGGELQDPVTFRTILGELVDTSALGIARARRGGTAFENRFAEGFWRESGDALMLGRGTELDSTRNPVTGQPLGSFLASRFLRYWAVGSDGMIVLLKGYGPGTNASNDCALVHVTRHASPSFEKYAYQVLLREGDPVSAGDCPRVRAIQRVEVDPINGNYAIVAALTGAPNRNQALFVGNAGLGHPNPGSGENPVSPHALRLPRIALRKGTIFNTPHSESTRLRSIVMQPIVDRTGAGGKGHGQVLNRDGELVLCLQFDNGAKELVVGKP